ncbi:MAG: arginine--tRNA ligase, partial [Mycoplasmataceae bacterium]|nr:arginine--tRNA ligase [Mycoplasmataceae bacterium]
MINKISNELKKILEENKWDTSKISVSKNKNIEFGEFNTNIAFLLSKELRLNPMDLANEIVSKFNKKNLSYIKDIKVVNPGFINFYLNDKYYVDIVKTVVQNKEYGKKVKNNITINVEFVSANPTGFLHVAHARGAAFGDSLSNILDYAGYNVIREYYINDVGNQIDRLAISIYTRYHQELGVE